MLTVLLYLIPFLTCCLTGKTKIWQLIGYFRKTRPILRVLLFFLSILGSIFRYPKFPLPELPELPERPGLSHPTHSTKFRMQKAQPFAFLGGAARRNTQPNGGEVEHSQARVAAVHQACAAVDGREDG